LAKVYFLVLENIWQYKNPYFRSQKKSYDITDKISQIQDIPKNITCDLSPTYEKFCNTVFPQATQIADKFHVIKNAIEALQAVRIRLKQSYLSSLPKDKKERKAAEKKHD